jgi:D-3-phosphoglycerate dehydrogenase
MSRKVLFTEGLLSSARSVLLSRKDLCSVEIFEDLSQEELLRAIPDVEVLSIRTRTSIGKEILTAAKKLKLIARAGTGVDHIDLEFANSLGIRVMNTASANSLSAAELTIGLLLSSARSISKADAAIRNHQWKMGPGIELHNKTLGILGLGRVGRLVATRLQAFGMKVIATDPYKSQDYADQIGVRLVSLQMLLSSSDVISLHAPLTSETQKLLDKDCLKLIKPGAILVNTARGAIIDEQSVLGVLNSGGLRSYAADVFEFEPLPETHPFRGHPKVILSPHIGAQTVEAIERVNTCVANQILNYLLTGEVLNEVFPSGERELQKN